MYYAVAYMLTRNAEVEIGFEFDGRHIDGDREDLFGLKNIEDIDVEDVTMLNGNRQRKLDFNKMSDENKKKVREAIDEFGDSDELYHLLEKYKEPAGHLVDALEERHRLTGRWI